VTIIGNQSIGNYYGFKLSDIAKNTSHIIFANNEVRANTAAGVIINTNDLSNKLTVKGNILNGNVKGIIISGNTEGLILRDNDISNTTDEDITISGTHTNAVIKGNTYMGTISSTATYSGVTTWVEQFNI
jgi:nitrous oxidase accessory protein NosD